MASNYFVLAGALIGIFFLYLLFTQPNRALQILTTIGTVLFRIIVVFLMGVWTVLEAVLKGLVRLFSWIFSRWKK